jgi:hypothetical protein
MRKFIRDQAEGGTIAPEVDTCPLCRIWASAMQDLSQQRSDGYVMAVDREQAHSFLVAGFWAALNKPELEVCSAHASHLENLDSMLEADEAEEDSPS